MTAFPKPKRKPKKPRKYLKRIPLRRQRKTPRAKLIRELDSVVSKIVIKRDGHCVIPDCKTPNQQLGASHLFSRRFYNTRWNLANVWTNCWPHNYAHVHDTSTYTIWFIENYGLENYKTLKALAHSGNKYSRTDLEELLEELKKQL